MGWIESGALARTTQEYRENGFDYAKGVEFMVESHITAEEASEEHGFYIGDLRGGYSNIDVHEDHAELVKSAQEMRSRKLPSLGEIANSIASEALGFSKYDFDLFEREMEEGAIVIYGKTEGGLPFAANFKVTSVVQVDA